jgi:O-antigen ligase
VAGLALQASATPGALVAVLVLAGPVWLVARRALGRFELPRLRIRSAWVVAGVLVLGVLAGSLAFGSSPGRGDGAASGFLHGRASTWEAAVETFADRPLAGAGADAFLAGSARHQHGQTIVFAHDLPIELGAELGVGGLALAVGLYLAIAHGLWRVRRTTVAWLLGPAAVAFPVANLVDWPWHLAGAGAAWAVAVGALAGAVPRGQKVPELRIQGDS